MKWTYTVTFVPIPVPPLYHVEGVLTRDGFDWQCKKGPDGPTDQPPLSWANCDVRVRAHYASAEADVLDDAKARVREIFKEARRFEFEPIAIAARTLRAPEVVQAQTLDDKLRAWAKLSNVAWSERIDACARLLQSTDLADTVIDNVDAWIADLVKGGDVREPVSDDVPVLPTNDRESELSHSSRVEAVGRASSDNHETPRDTLF